MLTKILNKWKNAQASLQEMIKEKQDVEILSRDSSPIEQHLSKLEIPKAENVEHLMAQLLDLDYFKTCNDFFCKYPPDTLINATSRTILYVLTRFLNPDYVLEIGTYRAGSSEIIASALSSNGKGILITIDPFGQERVPAVLNTWPLGLKQRISYMPVSSMDCFIKLAHNLTFNLIFVDGDHSFEHALYDLQMAATYVVPGGIVIMDNVEQTGVYWAAKTFMSMSPGWRELGCSLAEHDLKNPYETMSPSFEGSGFLILQAPDSIFINQRPRSFETKHVVERGLSGFDLSFTGEQKDGFVNALIFFRSFMHGGKPGAEQQRCVVRFPIFKGMTSHRIAFEKPFVTTLDPSDSFRTFEIVLSYTSNDDADAMLEMTTTPIPIKLS